VPFSRVVYIEATDFRLQDSKDYYGLAPGKSAMLRWAPCSVQRLWRARLDAASSRSSPVGITLSPPARPAHPPPRLLLPRYAYPITVTGHKTGPDGSVVELTAEADLNYASSGRKPPKGVLNWVGQPAPGKEPEAAEVRNRRAGRGQGRARAARCC
jgi:glutaminyl-tRNA synthetase